jgi:hypothetical protein
MQPRIDGELGELAMISARAPMIAIRGLAEEEVGRVRALEGGLYQLGSFCADVHAAVTLFERSRDQRAAHLSVGEMAEIRAELDLLTRWQFMACRDTAITIYNFSEALESIGININKLPAILAKLDARAKRRATRAFSNNFPSFQGLRHSAAHTGKLFGTPESLKRHKPKANVTVINSLLGNNFTTSFEGRQISLSMGWKIFTDLCEIRDLYWALFRPFDPFSLSGSDLTGADEPTPPDR